MWFDARSNDSSMIRPDFDDYNSTPNETGVRTVVGSLNPYINKAESDTTDRKENTLNKNRADTTDETITEDTANRNVITSVENTSITKDTIKMKGMGNAEGTTIAEDSSSAENNPTEEKEPTPQIREDRPSEVFLQTIGEPEKNLSLNGNTNSSEKNSVEKNVKVLVPKSTLKSYVTTESIASSTTNKLSSLDCDLPAKLQMQGE